MGENESDREYKRETNGWEQGWHARVVRDNSCLITRGLGSVVSGLKACCFFWAASLSSKLWSRGALASVDRGVIHHIICRWMFCRGRRVVTVWYHMVPSRVGGLSRLCYVLKLLWVECL